MIKLESFFRDNTIPPYSQVWRHALRMLQEYIIRYSDSNGPPTDDEQDDFNTALDNVVWLRDMSNAGDEPDGNEYRQWWMDFVVSITSSADASYIKYPEVGCDGEIRFEYMEEVWWRITTC